MGLHNQEHSFLLLCNCSIIWLSFDGVLGLRRDLNRNKSEILKWRMGL